VVASANTGEDPQKNEINVYKDLNIYNMAGQLCFKMPIFDAQPSTHDIQIPTTLSAGTYIAQYKNYSIKIILTDNR